MVIMVQLQRHISAVLALVMLFTSVLNTVLVVCNSGSDHHAIEVVGHQVMHSIDADAPSDHTSVNHNHPEYCTDMSLLTDSLSQRNKQLQGWEDISPTLIIVYSIDESVAAVAESDLSKWPASLNALWLRPASDHLATIRLLI